VCVASGPRVVRLGSGRSLAELGHDFESWEAFGYDLERRVGVTAGDNEPGGVRSYVLVLGNGQLDAFDALQVGALTEERNPVLGGAPLDRRLFDALVHVTEETLIFGPASIPVHYQENGSP
jgi:hypothetical protein